MQSNQEKRHIIHSLHSIMTRSIMEARITCWAILDKRAIRSDPEGQRGPWTAPRGGSCPLFSFAGICISLFWVCFNQWSIFLCPSNPKLRVGTERVLHVCIPNIYQCQVLINQVANTLTYLLNKPAEHLLSARHSLGLCRGNSWRIYPQVLALTEPAAYHREGT